MVPGHGEPGVLRPVLAAQHVLVNPQLDGSHAGQAQCSARGELDSAAGQAAFVPARRDSRRSSQRSLRRVSQPDDADELRLPAAAMAESPALITGFVGLRTTLATTGTVTGAEREIIALAVSIENNCDYCMAAHSTFALMQDAPEQAVMAARAGAAPNDPRLGALYRFARTQALLNAGYPPSAVVELVAQVAHTTMANLAHSISHAPVDQAFAPQAWPPAAA